ncbi:transcriptional regulator [Cellulomonas fengjieae]|uniref:Transcriptional regulator n=1 Tax=Cellulomonas fengjieae TaxID=2819978 RepID=A0ABS3SGE7_9CELL|nr:transcriptional regulator [Cellulomonas fengjieae]MBO3084722.1 transcriptional regulator [Cellulomonas fengjieae]MBO3103504.1 transcriptional regulator [Cellulomonas fengjieae]QVI66956.1 transcriptional regulator [Cellulomonas fengjieae]
MTSALDPVIHPVHRLQVCAMLDAATTLETSVIKHQLGLSASALSKQVAALIDAGYVRQDRSGPDSRKVWLSLTKAGSAAYHGHVAALQAIVAQTETTPSAPAPSPGPGQDI